MRRTVVLVLLLSGCAGEEPAPAVENELRLRSGAADATFRPEPGDVRCGPSRADRSVEVVKLDASSPQEAFLHVEVRPVEEATTYDLPADRADVLMTVVSEVTRVSTAATRTPETADAIEVLEASCDPVRLLVRVDGKLGAAGAGPALTASGGIDVTGDE
jgi:hypothetical protein